MRKHLNHVGIALPLLLFSGCAWFAHPTFHMPNWGSPGPAFYQQYQAIRHDPYPQNDVAPEIVGGRPRAYQQPPTEVSRIRQPLPWGNWQGQSP
jgi:hypothetical protein